MFPVFRFKFPVPSFSELDQRLAVLGGQTASQNANLPSNFENSLYFPLFNREMALETGSLWTAYTANFNNLEHGVRAA